MAICKNCGGDNKKVILNYTPKSYTICPNPGECPELYKCSEIIDSACIQYTNNNIKLCDTSYVVINKFESLESAFASILEVLCQTPPRCTLKVDIVPNPDETKTPTLNTVITNGEAPYTYKWEIAQGDFVGHFISGSSTSSSLNLTCIAANAIKTSTLDKNIKLSNIKLTVTDSRGCIDIVHFVYSSDCYAMVTTEPQPRKSFLGNRLVNSNGTKTKLAHTPMDFLDNPQYMPTCVELKNMCCIECYEFSEEASSEFREQRDIYLKNLNENLLNENVGGAFPDRPINYSNWFENGLGDITTFYKGGLMSFNFLLGCPECSFRLWNLVEWPQLGNQTLAERFPTIDVNTGDKFVWLPAVPFGSTPPIGQPGQLVKWQNDPLDPTIWGEYGWDPVTNSWSLDIGEILSEINTTDRGRRDAWFKAFNELVLANNPFIWANEYAMLHRYKYELKYPT